ncbi:MAG: topoisomerase I protein, partial [Microgenomates group bacterium GW2011_GWC1_44_9]
MKAPASFRWFCLFVYLSLQLILPGKALAIESIFSEDFASLDNTHWQFNPNTGGDIKIINSTQLSLTSNPGVYFPYMFLKNIELPEKDFVIESSYGHVRDLPKSQLGVDVENNFAPKYIVQLKARKNVSALKQKAAKAEKIILATDEDREGEAIAWHLISALGLEDRPRDNIERIVFHEITERAIKEAL